MTDHRCGREGRCHQTVKVEQRPATCAECACHAGGPYAPCSVPGGCGHLHKPVLVRIGGPIMAADGLCPTCTRAAVFAINELPRDYVDLNVALEHGVVGMTDLVSATKDLPAPLRISVASIAAEMVRVAVMFAEPVAERLRIEWDSSLLGRHARPGYALQRATRLLGRNISVLLALRDIETEVWAENGWYHTFEETDGISGALALMELHYAARGILGHTKLVHELPRSAPCPACGGQLVRDNGDSHVHCVRCPEKWSEEDYRRLVLVCLATRQADDRQVADR
jgi:hypothetical protein